MPADCVLWFDARCSASRRALELLRERGVEPDLRRFLEEPPTAEEIVALLRCLGAPPHALARVDADEYQALRLSERTPPDELIRALVQHPRILDRPIVVSGGRAVVVRQPERISALPLPGKRNDRCSPGLCAPGYADTSASAVPDRRSERKLLGIPATGTGGLPAPFMHPARAA